MQLTLQSALLVCSFITFIFILVTVKKTRMNIRYAIVWIAWGIIIIILSIFPQIIDKLSVILSISIPTNTLFLIFIFLLYILSFYLFIKVSQLSEEIKTLTYSISALQKEIHEIKK
ncbi:MAG: DUF2304 domain-containing protein [Bacilli bacterium]